jgi:hypothetical protein
MVAMLMIFPRSHLGIISGLTLLGENQLTVQFPLWLLYMPFGEPGKSSITTTQRESEPNNTIELRNHDHGYNKTNKT